MRRLRLVLAALMIAPAPAGAGLFHRKPAQVEAPPSPLVAPNGVAVPSWAARRMRESPVPLAGQSWGRRPWAMPLAQQATPSAYWARASQFGFGAGPVPGYTNGPALGNIPSAPIGPDGGPLARRGFAPSPFLPWLYSPAGN